MVCSVVGAVGYLLATTISEDDKLDLAAVLCVIGFTCYFVEARMRDEVAPSDGAVGGKLRPNQSLPIGARLFDSLLFSCSERGAKSDSNKELSR